MLSLNWDMNRVIRSCMVKTKMRIFCTSYCNKGHCLDTGKPVEHECIVIPVKALEYEMDGNIKRAILEMIDCNRKVHRGIKQK